MAGEPAHEPEPSAGEQRIDAVIASYLQAEKDGNAPSPEGLLARYPDLAGPLQSFLADRELFARAAEPLRPWPAGRETDLGLPATVRYFGDYELLEEIARGGMGVVYRARQISLNRIIALKMIRADQLATPDEVRRFRQEAEAAAGL